MYLLYSLALSILFLALLPYFIYQAIKHGKYASSFKERMGRLPESARWSNRPTIWLHAVSVGEFNAARPLIARLRSELPDHAIVVSTTTITGQRLARSQPQGSFDAVFYFPFDWRFAVRRALDHTKPAMVIILETELWPNFLRECSSRRLATVVVNGRISPRSFARYKRARPLIARALNDISLMIMQSEEDARRAIVLGAPPDRVRVCGNLKYDIASAQPEEQAAADDLDRRLALSSSPRLVVAGSTAPGEERIVLDALSRVRSHDGLKDARLLIAPRHPERFNEVAHLIAQSGFSLARRSEADVTATRDNSLQTADVILLDTVGELARVYRFAAVVFVGGSLVARGGHNIIEPALYAKPIIVGPHTENFRQIVSDFASAEAVTQISRSGDDSASELARQLVRLMSRPAEARAMGERARAILIQNRGATDCTVAALKKIIYAGR